MPGRVLLRAHSVPFVNDVGHPVGLVDAWVPCLVVSSTPVVRQRHNRVNSPRLGWDVLVFWFDDRQKRLDNVFIAVEQQGWKVGW